MASHISQLSDMTARGILGATLQDDSYHMAILHGASEMVAHGLGHMAYVTQWATGTTVWEGGITLRIGDNEPLPHRMIVDHYGRIA